MHGCTGHPSSTFADGKQNRGHQRYEGGGMVLVDTEIHFGVMTRFSEVERRDGRPAVWKHVCLKVVETVNFYACFTTI